MSEDTNKPFNELPDQPIRLTCSEHELFTTDECISYENLRLFDPLARIYLNVPDKPVIMSYEMESPIRAFWEANAAWKYQTFPMHWPFNFNFSPNSDKNLQDLDVWYEPYKKKEEKRRFVAGLKTVPTIDLHPKDYNYAIMIPSKITGSPTLAQTLNETADRFALRELKGDGLMWGTGQHSAPGYDGLIPTAQKNIFDPVGNPLTIKMIRDVISKLPKPGTLYSSPFYWNEKRMHATVGDEVKVTIDMNALIREYLDKDEKNIETHIQKIAFPELIDEMNELAKHYARLERLGRIPKDSKEEIINPDSFGELNIKARRCGYTDMHMSKTFTNPYYIGADPFKPGASASVISVHSIHNQDGNKPGEKLVAYYRGMSEEDEQKAFREEIERLAAYYNADVIKEFNPKNNNSPMQFYIRQPKGCYAVQWKGFNLDAFSLLGLLSVNKDEGHLTVSFGNDRDTGDALMFSLGMWLVEGRKGWRVRDDYYMRREYQLYPHQDGLDYEAAPRYYVRKPRGKFAIQWKGFNMSDFAVLGWSMNIGSQLGTLNIYNGAAPRIDLSLTHWFVFNLDEKGQPVDYQTMSETDFWDEYMHYSGDPKTVDDYYNKPHPSVSAYRAYHSLRADLPERSEPAKQNIPSPSPDLQPMNTCGNAAGPDYGALNGGQNLTR